MRVEHSLGPGRLTVYLAGELDHHSASDAVREMDSLIDRMEEKTVILDMSGVTFMDSSGIALVLGRYNILKRRGAELSITGAPDFVRHIFSLCGLERLIRIGGMAHENAVK